MSYVELTFNEAVGESEVHLLLLEAIKDGRLGQLQVDKVVVGITILGEHNLTVIALCNLICSPWVK